MLGADLCDSIIWITSYYFAWILNTLIEHSGKQLKEEQRKKLGPFFLLHPACHFTENNFNTKALRCCWVWKAIKCRCATWGNDKIKDKTQEGTLLENCGALSVLPREKERVRYKQEIKEVSLVPWPGSVGDSLKQSTTQFNKKKWKENKSER